MQKYIFFHGTLFCDTFKCLFNYMNGDFLCFFPVSSIADKTRKQKFIKIHRKTQNKIGFL